MAVAAAVQARREDSAADPGVARPSADPVEIVTTPLLSARRAPEWLRQPLDDRLLTDEVRAVLASAEAPDTTCLSVHRDDTVILAADDDLLLVPASAMKLVTAAALLEVAPPDDRYRTEAVIRADAPIADGVLDGDLWLVGGGDPVLSTPDYIERYDEPRVHTDLTELADAVANELASRGIVEITGGVVGDESKYTPAERDYTGEVDGDGNPIWKAEFRTQNQAGPLSALLVNDGYTAWPDEPNRRQNSRASDPALAAARLFDDLLEERGLVIRGSSRNEVAPAVSERISLGVVESPTIGEIIGRMLRHSDNTTAEMLLKEIGVRSGVGAQRGLAVFAVAQALDRAGYPVQGRTLDGETTTIQIADGSGLSSLNRITCRLVEEILRRSGPDSVIADGLAVVGESGTLARCLVDDPSARGDVEAKTGTLNDVTALAGLTVADNGDVVTFAMIANGEGVGARLGSCNELQTTLIRGVANHPYGPDVDALSPEPPATVVVTPAP
ncbi:MAG: hypothetical protein D6683_02235 [Actinomyces sp.]|nr:MAG: hypothetical protein D6683_02235 [Actinomyces sp.]